MSGERFAVTTAPAVELYLDPPSHHFLGDRLFEQASNPLCGDDSLAAFVRAREHFATQGIPVRTADFLGAGTGRTRLYVSLGRTAGLTEAERSPGAVASALFVIESPVVEPRLYRALPELERRFRRLYTWSDPDSFRAYSRRPFRSQPFRFPQPVDGVRVGIWERRDRRFLTLVNANKWPRHPLRELYGERRRAIAHFAAHGEIDVYGPHWQSAPRRVGESPWPATLRRLGEWLWSLRQRWLPDPIYAACSRASRGTTASKHQTLGGYRFALCYENAEIPGYITEKIFDCFACGTVPVYLGAPDVAEWIPEECFVDRRRFADDAELRRHLHQLSPREVEDMRLAARSFLVSDRFAPFRPHAFLEKLRRIVREDAGVEA